MWEPSSLFSEKRGSKKGKALLATQQKKAQEDRRKRGRSRLSAGKKPTVGSREGEDLRTNRSDEGRSDMAKPETRFWKGEGVELLGQQLSPGEKGRGESFTVVLEKKKKTTQPKNTKGENS